MAKLTKESLLEIVRLDNQTNISNAVIGKMFDVNSSTISRFLNRKTFKDFWEEYDNKPHLSGSLEETVPEVQATGTKYVITCAQNNTYVHDGFLKSLENYCQLNDAELLISTFVYDRSGFKRAEKDADKSSTDYWYDPKIEKYRFDQRLKLAEGLIFCGELNINPTEVNPISGFHNYIGENSGIIPHAKLKMKSLPRHPTTQPRLMYTTGTVTQRNYIQRKTGQKASIHHAFAALVVEIDKDGDWFVRQLHAEKETGHFYDLDSLYMPDSVISNNEVAAINYGDIHSAKLDKDVAELSWDSENSILDTLRPRYQFVHDVFDAQARNHHNSNDPHFLFDMYVNGTESIAEEVYLTGYTIKQMKRDFSKVVIVESNHDLALEKYLKEQDYRKDPVNAVFFLELQLAKYKAIQSYQPFKTFKYALDQVSENIWTDDVIFLDVDSSFIVEGIECGSHGHLGNNGSRGSINTYKLQGSRINIGHTHTPSIDDGVYCAGVSGKLNMGYNKGGTSWVHAHIITYPNGKRTIIDIKNNKWHG